ncbi:MAG: OmpA family protein [Flavobacteriales bacterium]
MIKLLGCSAVLCLALSSCVSTKKYEALSSKNQNLMKEIELHEENFSSLKISAKDCSMELEEAKYNETVLGNDLEIETKQKAYFKRLYEELNADYSTTVDSKEAALRKVIEENTALIDQLQDQNRKMIDLEANIQAAKNKLSQLRSKISQALSQFEGRGMNVQQKDGKLYISLDNSLLFASGKWDLGSAAKPAIKQLAEVLVQEKDLEVLIEGHTDNVDFNGSSVLKDNWDLSVKRATSVVKELTKNKALEARRLTAAGRGEFNPIAGNDTKAGKAKNRRIEIIIQPDLSIFGELLSE